MYFCVWPVACPDVPGLQFLIFNKRNFISTHVNALLPFQRVVVVSHNSAGP